LSTTQTTNPPPVDWIVTAWALYDLGHRGTQEDRHDLRVLPGMPRFVVVTDGAGGPPAGEEAAEIGISVIGRACRATEYAPGKFPIDPQQFMKGLFVAGDEEVKQVGKDHPEKKGLGAACVMMLEVAPNFHFLGAGDARAYAFDGQILSRMTTDQSGSEPQSITSALGWLDTDNMSYQTKPVNEVFPGDRGVLVLCSDGLTKLVRRDSQITEILKQGGTAQQICERLMAKAKAAGGRRDNITIVVLLYVRA
jgi:serine/threonine protein phosphatase PrpC